MKAPTWCGPRSPPPWVVIYRITTARADLRRARVQHQILGRHPGPHGSPCGYPPVLLPVAVAHADVSSHSLLVNEPPLRRLASVAIEDVAQACHIGAKQRGGCATRRDRYTVVDVVATGIASATVAVSEDVWRNQVKR